MFSAKLQSIIGTFLIVMLVAFLASCEGANDDDDDVVSLRENFAFETSVFEIPVYASAGVSHGAIQHVARILAQYLDSDEDQTPNNQAVVNQLKNTAAMVIFATESELEATLENIDGEPDRAFVTVIETEMQTTAKISTGPFDPTLEEVLHLVTQLGYSIVHSELAEEQGSQLANAMDLARGSATPLLTPPENVEDYPEGAWYTYTDQSCEYNCQITEYIYWGLTSFLGAQSFDGRLEQIQDEWDLNTAQKIEDTDTPLFNILTNEDFAWPTVIPSGNYREQTFAVSTIQ